METESKAMRVWLAQLDTQSEGTKKIYLRTLEAFLTRFKIEDGESLYRMKLDDLRSEDTRDRLRVEGMVKTYMVGKVKDGAAPMSAAQTGKAVVSFFKAQNVPFNLGRGDYPKGTGPGRRIISKEQIAEIYDKVGAEFRERNRALIMVLKDSGLRISDVVSLNVGNYTEAQVIHNADGEPFRVFDPVLTKKAKVNAFVHLGPESVKVLDTYLKERGNVRLDPLFTDRFRKRLGVTACSIQFDRLCKNIEGVSRLGAHSFRKFHFTALESAGVPQNWIKLLEGKNLGQSIGAYSHPEESGELTQTFIRSYDKLRVFGREGVQDLELRAKTQHLEAKVDTLTNEMEVFRNLAARMVYKDKVLKDIDFEAWEEVERRTVSDEALREAWEDREKRMKEEGIYLDIRARPRSSKNKQ